MADREANLEGSIFRGNSIEKERKSFFGDWFDSSNYTQFFGKDSKKTTTTENKDGVTNVEESVNDDGSKQTISEYRPFGETAVSPDIQKIINDTVAKKDILSMNKPAGPVMGENARNSADGMMTEPVIRKEGSTINERTAANAPKLQVEDVKRQREAAIANGSMPASFYEKDSLFKDSPQFDPDDTESYPRGTNELVNPDGSVNRENLDPLWDPMMIGEDEELVGSVPAAVKSIKTLEGELKALQDNPKARKEKYLEFLRENGTLKEWRPDLFKGLAGTAFRLLMGDSKGDAFSYSFGVMQEQKNVAAEAKAKKDAADAKARASLGNDIEYSKDAKIINIGTAQNPIEVRTTTGKSDGVGYFSYQGQNIKMSALKNQKSREILGLGPLNSNLPTGYSESFSTADTNEAITKNVGVLSGLLKRAIGYDDADDKDKAFYDSGMLAESQLYNAIHMLKESGVDVGPNMNPVFMASLQESAINFLKHREISPKSTKQYTSFVKDDIIVADMRGIGLGQETYIAPQYIPGTKDEFKMNESSFSEVISNANTFVAQHARKSGDARVEALQTGISRNKIGFAHAMYEEWLKNPKNASEQGKKNVAAKNMAGYEAGYLPFHYWLRTQTR
jgi:hypothetical protein